MFFGKGEASPKTSNSTPGDMFVGQYLCNKEAAAGCAKSVVFATGWRPSDAKARCLLHHCEGRLRERWF